MLPTMACNDGGKSTDTFAYLDATRAHDKIPSENSIMLVTVHWNRVRPESEHLFRMSRVLYAYTTRDLAEVLYIGKATTTTVRQRWNAADKSAFWSDLENERGIFGHQVLIGNMQISDGFRFSRELLADVESLLIYRLQPWGNIQCQTSRISRPGLTLKCLGDWPSKRAGFRDR
jgi:hypothetical protein